MSDMNLHTKRLLTENKHCSREDVRYIGVLLSRKTWQTQSNPVYQEDEQGDESCRTTDQREEAKSISWNVVN